MMTMATKHTIIEEKLAKYLKASKEGKSELLDYICEITGLHCALKEIRELFGEICTKRLHPNPAEYVRVLAVQGD
jgi:hypothetical protein